MILGIEALSAGAYAHHIVLVFVATVLESLGAPSAVRMNGTREGNKVLGPLWATTPLQCHVPVSAQLHKAFEGGGIVFADTFGRTHASVRVRWTAALRKGHRHEIEREDQHSFGVHDATSTNAKVG